MSLVMAESRAPQTIASLRARDRHAGEEERVTFERGGIVMMYDPLEFYVRSKQVAVSPMEGAILELLVRQGRASSQALLDLFERENGSPKALDVHVHRIRRKFLTLGLFDPIETVRGWGLKLSSGLDAAPIHRIAG